MQFLRVFRFLALLWHNNQFYLEVPSPCCVVIALMQKYRLCGDDRRFLSCGCLIYQVRRTVHDHNIIYIYILYIHIIFYMIIIIVFRLYSFSQDIEPKICIKKFQLNVLSCLIFVSNWLIFC